jgi:hypothetical protein
LFTHIYLGLPSGILPSGFPTNILYANISNISTFHSSHPPFVLLCSAHHPPWLDYPNYTWQIVQATVTSSVLCPNILPSTLSLCFFHNIKDQVSDPYRTTVKIIVLYIQIFMFLDSRWEDKRFWTEL